MLFKGINQKLKRKLIIGTLLLFVLALSMAGGTYAWFTDSSVTIQNMFTAGTVQIDVDDESNDHEANGKEIVIPGEPFQKQFNITNQGSKSIYVRAVFDGYWEQLFHRNTAVVTAKYGDTDIDASDSAHFFYVYENNNDLFQDLNNGEYIGFTDKKMLSSRYKIAPGNTNDNNSNNSLNPTTQTMILNNNETCPQVPPIEYHEEHPYFENAFNNTDPNPGDLPFPEGCSERYMLKIDLDEDDVVFGKSYKQYDNDVSVRKYVYDDEEGWDETKDGVITNFEAVITDWGNGTFKFDSTIPVYHVYVKGGPGGNLYSYYHPAENPAFPDGVTMDCGLSQPPTGAPEEGKGWSHIVFYFCDEDPPDPEPEIDFKKEVSVDGGITWDDADTPPGPKLLDPEVNPMFKFTVTNTGNVPLTDVVIEDDVFDLDPDNDNTKKWFIGELNPEDSVEREIEYEQWLEKISVENIQVKLCDNMVNWTPKGYQDLGTYFYHTEVLTAEEDGSYQVTLCVDILFDNDSNFYEGTEFILYAYFEAVQASNDIILDNWPVEDLGWYLE